MPKKSLASSKLWKQKHPWSIHALTSSDMNLTTEICTQVIAVWMLNAVLLVYITVVVTSRLFFSWNPHYVPLVVRCGIVGSTPQAVSCPFSHFWRIWWGTFATELRCSLWSTPTAQTTWNWRVCSYLIRPCSVVIIFNYQLTSNTIKAHC